jgi:hypothetical protein
LIFSQFLSGQRIGPLSALCETAEMPHTIEATLSMSILQADTGRKCMNKNHDSKSELREEIKNRVQKETTGQFLASGASIFIQVTQSLVFMYLIFFGYMLMGAVGLVFVSVLFILALLSPALLRAGRELWRKRASKTSGESPISDRELNQEG